MGNGVTVPVADQKETDATRAILRHFYKAYAEDPLGSAYSNSMPPTPELPANLLAYVAERFDGVYWDAESVMGGGDRIFASIRPEGIKLLREMGEATFLDTDLRFRLLVMLRDVMKEHGKHAYPTMDELRGAASGDESSLLQNLKFLAAEGLVEIQIWGRENVEATITQRGIELAESFEAHGGEPPDSHTPFGRYQHTVGPNERARAETIFRDQVELARREVILVDPYAKEPLFDWLRHVPAGVPVRILTTKDALSWTYAARLKQEQSQRPVEVRLVAKSAFPHGRFVIRDHEVAWSWDASFHDAGVKRHTITELEPVNCQVHLKDFNGHWPTATPVA